MAADSQSVPPAIYTESFVKQLQVAWGAGFLSPGGPDEVTRLLAGINITGAQVLDLGCGIGGPGREMLTVHGARHVLGVDIEPGVLEQARQAAAEAGLQGRADFQLIQPGPLPFGPATFDLVFSKDVMIRNNDKQPIYEEVWRVLGRAAGLSPAIGSAATAPCRRRCAGG